MIDPEVLEKLNGLVEAQHVAEDIMRMVHPGAVNFQAVAGNVSIARNNTAGFVIVNWPAILDALRETDSGVENEIKQLRLFVQFVADYSNDPVIRKMAIKQGATP